MASTANNGKELSLIPLRMMAVKIELTYRIRHKEKVDIYLWNSVR
jgi:hypothetical protein